MSGGTPWSGADPRRPRFAPIALAAALLCSATGAAAGVLSGHCQDPPARNAAQHDALLQFSAVVRKALQDSGAEAALVARSGLDLSSLGLRYSHAGLSLRESPQTPWAVRQLYYACDEGRPLIFDQGLAAFLGGLATLDSGHVAVLLLPADAARTLVHAALDPDRALGLLGRHYSANAYGWGLQYQNCNQWLAELLATAWGDLSAGEGLRARAQHWLQSQAYHPTRITVSPLVSTVGTLVPWLRRDDHPPEAAQAGVFTVSMPASLEAFVQTRVAGARRLEFCLGAGHIIMRSGWTPLDADCVAAPGDTVLPLKAAAS